MDRLITVSEYVADYQQGRTVKPYLRDGGSLWQIFNIEPRSGGFKVETARGTFQRGGDELIMITPREQKARVARAKR